MFTPSRFAASLQLTLIVIVAIWIGSYAGLITSVTATWLSAGVVAAFLLLKGFSRQSEQPKSMTEILHDLENPRRP